MKGEAEAFAIEAKAAAEAEQMAKKADAWKEYREAAVVDMVLATMPKVHAENTNSTLCFSKMLYSLLTYLILLVVTVAL